MILDSSTFIEPIPYRRVPHIRESVHNHLRSEILRMYPDLEIDWNKEKITTAEVSPAKKKCESRLLVILSVEI